MHTTSPVLDLEQEFLRLHTTKEDLFWQAKMGLGSDADKAQKALAEAEIAMNAFLQDPVRLERLRDLEKDAETDEERHVIGGWIRMLAAHVIEDPKGRALAAEIVELEQALQARRATCKLGYTDPATGQFEAASSVRLALMMRTDKEEARRKAAYQGLRDLEHFVLEAGFLDIVRKRNQLGRLLGYEDYYDWRVNVVERMTRRHLFHMLDDLNARTSERARTELQAFAKKHGSQALEPWNFGYLRSGDLTRKLDPYFQFADALDRWGRSFTALGVRYHDARLTLDLVDRKGKYENGFMHGPEPRYRIDHQGYHPARINFTSNAIPGQVGSGLRALETLMHEGGHAAHFSNIEAPSPCFSHEFAPTSVAYAETQSMFMDSLVEDADWRALYAGMPWDLIEEAIREKQPFMGWDVRALLTIPLAERDLYLMDDPTPEKVLAAFRAVERDTQGLTAGVRPVLAVPHLLAGESSAYYHGYIMADMAVWQTRAFFLNRDGFLSDNPRVGPDLARHYWAPGNAVPFNETLESLTGQPLSADALVAACNRTVEEAVAQARQAYDRVDGKPAARKPVQLDAHVRVVHGAETVADTDRGGFEQASVAFARWIRAQEGKP